MIAPLTMLALALDGVLVPWMVFGLVFVRGCVNAVDYPTRQAFVMEMVGTRPGRQRGQPEQRPRPQRARDRPGVRRRPDRDRRSGALLRPQRRQLRLDDLGARRDGHRALQPGEGGRAREPGAVRAGLRYVRGAPELWIPLGLMADRGDPRLQLPGRPAAARPLHLPRRRRRLRRAGRRDGPRRDRRRAGQRRPRLGHPDAAGRRRARLRRPLAAGRRRADSGARDRRAGAARRRDRDPGREHQLLAPARLGAEHARPGDGALLDRLPRLDADRRPALRLALRGGRPARGAGDGRGRRRSPAPCSRASPSTGSPGSRSTPLRTRLSRPRSSGKLRMRPTPLPA